MKDVTSWEKDLLRIPMHNVLLKWVNCQLSRFVAAVFFLRALPDVCVHACVRACRGREADRQAGSQGKARQGNGRLSRGHAVELKGSGPFLLRLWAQFVLKVAFMPRSFLK